jgi:NADPH:quinone reductase-like Zn-dependent oxidoreductase
MTNPGIAKRTRPCHGGGAMPDDEQLRIHRFGSPASVLTHETTESPRPAAGEVVVRVHAAPINPADLNWIEGTYGVRPELSATPGIEGCGIVDSSQAADFSPGDRVFFLHRAGSWATRVALPSTAACKLPAGIDLDQAAMLKVNPATAWRLLHGFTALHGGDWVVQNAGNSGVGRCLIQLARDLGVRTISFVRQPALAAELEHLGADLVLADDDDGRAAALDAMGGRHAALACNAVGGESALRLMNLLRDGGAHITYGAMARRPLTVPNGLLIFRDLAIRGLWVSRWIEQAPDAEIRQTYHELASRVADGRLVQPIDSRHPLRDFDAALTRNAAADRHGKVLFTP